jgi:hypothetical protein
MASATGTITFSGLPARYAHLILNDGQSDGVSQVTFAVNTTTGGGSGDAIWGTSASNNVFNGNASKAVTLYRSYSTSKSYLTISFQGDSQTNASFKDMATGGSTPLIYEFRDADGNVVNVTLVNESSGFTNNVSGGTYSRKDSAGNYSLNTNNAGVDADNIAEELKDILNAAKTAGEINITTATRASTYYLNFTTDAAGSGNAPLMFRIKRASGSWSSTTKVAAHVTRGYSLASGNLIAEISAPDEPVYSVRAAETGGSGELSSAAFAAYLSEIINNLPIQITATVDGSEVSLTNDVDGTSGNVAMSISDATNVSLSGMTGGSSGAGGGTSIMARTRIGTKLIAVGGITRDNISSGSIESAMLAQDQTFSFQKSVYVSGSSHLLGSLGVAGATTLDGAVTLGNATGDDVTVTGYVAASVIPKTTGASDLGSAALTWGTVFAESGSFSDNVGVGGDVAITGTSTLATVDINAGNIDGTIIGAASVAAGSFAAVVGTTATFSSTLTANGDTDLGNATSDTITATGRFDSDLVPSTDSARDLGTSALQWAEAHVDTGHIDTLTVTGTSTLTTVDIGAGAIDGITLGTNSAVTNANFTALTASYAKITSLDVDTIVSRTVTKDSLEIQDNLIIAGVSGSVAGDYIGAGFQLGGLAGVEGTGSSPLFSLTLGTTARDGDSLVFNVDGQSGMTLQSGSSTDRLVKVGNIIGPRLGVTGSISGSLVQGLRGDFGHLTAKTAVTVGTLFKMPDVTSGKIMVADGTSYEEVAVSGDVTIASNGAVSIGTGKVSLDNMATGSVHTPQLVADSVTGAKIADDAIDSEHYAAASVDFEHIQNVAANSLLIRNANSSGVLSELALATTQIMIGDGTGMIAAALSGDVTMTNAGAVSIGTGKVSLDNMATGSVQTPQLGDTSVTAAKLGALSVTKAKLNQDIVINKTDANGGLTFTSGLLSVGFRRRSFAQHNSTASMGVTDSMDGPYTTASLGAQPQSGSLMVYLNGLLLHPDHPGQNAGGPTMSDFRLVTASANAYKILLHEDLALDSDDILTVTYLSGSGTNS